MNPPNRPGKTQEFVLGRGFEDLHGRSMLIDALGNGREFYELTADADQSRFAPEDAFDRLLHSMPPGVEIRFLKVHWPNPAPRRTFLRQSAGWRSAVHELRPELFAGLERFLGSAPLPYFGQTFVEFVISGKDALAWADAGAGLLTDSGIEARKLSREEVLELARRVLNLKL